VNALNEDKGKQIATNNGQTRQVSTTERAKIESKSCNRVERERKERFLISFHHTKQQANKLAN
jgi:hypothetical protein